MFSRVQVLEAAYFKKIQVQIQAYIESNISVYVIIILFIQPRLFGLDVFFTFLRKKIFDKFTAAISWTFLVYVNFSYKSF